MVVAFTYLDDDRDLDCELVDPRHFLHDAIDDRERRPVLILLCG